MIGFDIGGTKCAVVIGKEENGNLLISDKKSFKTELDISPYEMIDKMCMAAQSMTDDFSKIGISCGGPLDSKNGVIMSPPNLPGWDNVEICDYLRKRYNAKVNLQNDANACAVAEWKYGAGRGTQNMVFFTFGTGLGAGLILDGKLYSGTNDMAGEAGHIKLNEYGPVGYGKSGSFEGFCSGNGIAQLGKLMATEKLQMGKSVSYCKSFKELDNVTAKSIAEFAEKGFEDALKVYEICAQKLGMGLSVIIDILNPEAIVLGSIYERQEKLFKDIAWKVIEQETLKQSRDVCKILPAKLGDSIGDYAALAVAEI